MSCLPLPGSGDDGSSGALLHLPLLRYRVALDDEQKTHAQLRDEWIARGMPWFSTYTQPPTRWSPADQLGLTAKR